jgi:hypothetical protein
MAKQRNPEREAAYDEYYTALAVDTHHDLMLRRALVPYKELCFRVLPEKCGTMLWENYVETIGQLMSVVEMFSVAGIVESLEQCNKTQAQELLDALRALAYQGRIYGLPKEARHLRNPSIINQVVSPLPIEVEFGCDDDDDSVDPYDTWVEEDATVDVLEAEDVETGTLMQIKVPTMPWIID